MNFAHLHLILTHFPPVLSLGSATTAAAGILLRGRRRDLMRLALLLAIAVGAMMPLVFIAGDRAADSIGKVEGINQDAIAPHQRAATIAISMSIGAAFVSIALLIVDRRNGGLSPALLALAMVVTIASAAAIGWTAALGGAIHHPEISNKV